MTPDRFAPGVKLEDVEWRVDSQPVQKEGRPPAARYVPHVNARIAARLMDDWVGPTSWSDEYRTVEIDGLAAVLCIVSVLCNDRWISKQDVGVPSSMEPQKGAISDAFKRCVTVKWGAGRNVYDLPSLWAPCGINQKGKAYPVAETLPALQKQLRAKGFTDADGGTVEDIDTGAGLLSDTASSPGSTGTADGNDLSGPAPVLKQRTKR